MRDSALSAAWLVLLTLLIPALSAAAPPPALSAQDAWVRATPGVEVAAAYLTLHNGGTQPVVVNGVTSPAAGAAMIHESALVNGQSTMRAHEPLRLGAGETVHFAPGGLHIMLHSLKRPLAPGDEVPLVLLLEGGGSLTVTARVRALGDS
ncbi:MAG TPA: copper chaperone PCu(A)C [Steroidobacteraceae bacterium]|nr:copper chaperone PCu(A)C [Steroidobacteraceae bacterium]